MSESPESGARLPDRGDTSPRADHHVVIFGCGFAGSAIARAALAAGHPVVVTTRDGERAQKLEELGVTVLVGAPVDIVSKILVNHARVVVAFPPDGTSDVALASALRGVCRLVYVSSTGVYGDAVGIIDGATPTTNATPRIAARLAAERAYLELGSVVLRAPAIYGKGRGLHERLRAEGFRMPGDGAQVVSRIHVDDLASFVIAALDRGRAGAVLTVADDAAVPQREVIEWLCGELGVPMPPSAPLDEVDETLRHDRRVDGSIAKNELGVELEYPTYREGFRACLAQP